MRKSPYAHITPLDENIHFLQLPRDFLLENASDFPNLADVSRKIEHINLLRLLENSRTIVIVFSSLNLSLSRLSIENFTT